MLESKDPFGMNRLRIPLFLIVPRMQTSRSLHTRNPAIQPLSAIVLKSCDALGKQAS